MNKTQPFIIEILCKPADPYSNKKNCHASVCAVAKSKSLAETMAKNLVMSHNYIVESVELVALKAALPLDDNTYTDNLLYQKALQREPPCALTISFFQEGHECPDLQPLKPPDVDRTRN